MSRRSRQFRRSLAQAERNLEKILPVKHTGKGKMMRTVYKYELITIRVSGIIYEMLIAVDAMKKRSLSGSKAVGTRPLGRRKEELWRKWAGI